MPRKNEIIQEARQRAAESPVAWYVMLESAIGRGDVAGERRARAELERLGVIVTHTQPARRASR
jgi:hypothetical protein